ncbi:MAG: alpha-galactosidase [Chloroflexota bacterium]
MPDVRFDENERGPLLESGSLRVQVHLIKGTFDVIDVASGVTVLRDAAVAVYLHNGPTFGSRGEGVEFSGEKRVDDLHGTGLSLALSRETDEDEPELSFTLTLYEAGFVAVQAEVRNTSPAPLRVQAFHVLDRAMLDLGVEVSALRFYKHGWQSWSPTLVLDCGLEDIDAGAPVVDQGTRPTAAEGRFTSDMMTAIVDPVTNVGIVAGFISNADQFSHAWFDRNTSALTAASYADGVEVAPRASVASEVLYIEPTTSPIDALGHYGDALALQMDALPYDRVTSGWCSWYYYFTQVTEADIVANLEFLDGNSAVPVEYVQIDDGYQSEIGDWLTANDKFPRGMKWLADEIHARGYKTGLWLAPFLAGAKSRIFAEHPDWFVQRTSGPAIATINWEQNCYALDLTHPDVIAWLRDVFRTICDEWGYDYVKIDFIYAGAVNGLRHDPNVTRAQAYRRGLEVIRETVGNRFILACGNPMGPAVGVVDGARISPDVAPQWHPIAGVDGRASLSTVSAENAIRNTITRFWMHGRLWMNDPDCLLVRETDTSLSGDEVRALTTVIGLSGGTVLNSDKLPKVSNARLDLISLLLPVYGRSAVPLDLFRTPDLPTLFELDCGTHRALAMFNWSDESGDVEALLPPGRWHVFELWEREYLGVCEGSLVLPTPPHGCRLLRLTRDLGRTQVVGSTLHITQGAMEIAREEWDGARLRIDLRPVAKRDGELYVWRGGRIETVYVEALTEERVLEL